MHRWKDNMGRERERDSQKQRQRERERLSERERERGNKIHDTWNIFERKFDKSLQKLDLSAPHASKAAVHKNILSPNSWTEAVTVAKIPARSKKKHPSPWWQKNMLNTQESKNWTCLLHPGWILSRQTSIWQRGRIENGKTLDVFFYCISSAIANN